MRLFVKRRDSKDAPKTAAAPQDSTVTTQVLFPPFSFPHL
jgi:hypothetical protein